MALTNRGDVISSFGTDGVQNLVLLAGQVCGQADVWGDGVVPEMSAHLEGAENLALKVYHSPVGTSDERPWYGTSKILDQWVHSLMG